MAIDILQALQGYQAGRGLKADRLAGALTGQLGMAGFDPLTSADFQKLMAIDPKRATALQGSFNQLSQERQGAFYKDIRKVGDLAQAGEMGRVRQLLQDRRRDIGRLGGDTEDTDLLISAFESDDMDKFNQLVAMADRVGVEEGFLSARTTDKPFSVQSAKIMDDGTVQQVGKGGGIRVISPTGELLSGNDAKEAIARSKDQAFERKKEIARLSQIIRREDEKAKTMDLQQREIQKSNIKRLSTLADTSTGRSAALKKAMKFKLALENGEAFSGAGRRAAQFVPGAWTSQGEFDEEFNAFAEVAARQALKASGETRPTDADVQGMKNSMFGVGRDEDVNIQLLDDFIREQQAQDAELTKLLDAGKEGRLSEVDLSLPAIQGANPSQPDPSLLEFMTPEERALFNGS